MFIAGLMVGGVVGSILGVVLVCLLISGKRADQEMEWYRDRIPERQEDKCVNEIM